MNWQRAIAACMLALGTISLLKRAAADLLATYGDDDAWHAATLEPGNANYLLAAGRISADAQKDQLLLEQAGRVNPSDASVWMELGSREEHMGGFAAAERYYLRAAEVSRQFLPRWTLANFYFRRQQTGAFSRWMKEAVAMEYDDATPLATLCMAAFNKPQVLVERCLGGSPRALRAYFDLLRQQNQTYAFGIAMRLVEGKRLKDIEPLLEYCDQLVREGRAHEAAQLWNALADAGLIGNRRRTGSQTLLSNSDFEAPLIRHGFDWQAADTPELRSVPQPQDRSIILYADGRQPDDCVLLSQLVPVTGAGKYRLKYRAEITSSDSAGGLGWTAFDGVSGKELSRSARTSEQYDFEIPPKTRLVRFALVCRRPSGSAKFEGRVRISDVSLRRL